LVGKRHFVKNEELEATLRRCRLAVATTRATMKRTRALLSQTKEGKNSRGRHSFP